MTHQRYHDILSHLSADTLILTVNQRLAAYLKKEFANLQSQAVWPQPNILPLNTWLTQFWNQHANSAPLLLNHFAEFLEWQRIIKRYAQENPIIQIQNTALLAQQAWQLAQQYKIDLDTELSHANEEILTFHQWADEFQRTLNKNHWLSSAEIPAAVIKLIKEQTLRPAHEIVLVGFDDLAPIYHDLISSLENTGISARHFQPQGQAQTVKRLELLDQKNEIESMARWANQQAQSHPQESIACLVPNLNVIRDEVDSVFKKICTQPYNLSAGKALSHYPIIQAALDLLSLNCDAIDLDLFSRNIMSIYHNSSVADRCASAKVASELNTYLSTQLTLANIRHEIARQSQLFSDSTLSERFTVYGAELKNAQTLTLRSYEWISVFQTILSAIHWPSARPLNSENYQVVCRWQELWAELAALDEMLGSIPYFTALAVLKNLALQTVFQQKSTLTNLHVMGLLESGGIEFDRVWLMGLDDETWPPNIKANPFLPLNLQRAKNMPHASSERELQYSLRTQQRLVNCCDELIISSAKKIGDKNLHPSRLIESIEEIELAELALEAYKNPITLYAEQAIEIESLVDDYGPAVSAEEITRGGSWILQEQAQCPFRAFVKIRLNANPEPEKSLGIDSAQRGSLTHTVLEKIWREIKSLHALNQLNEEKLSQLINKKIDEALRLANDLEPDFCAIEKQRLLELSLQWLALEKKRPPFTVLEQETNRFIQIGNLKLQVKIDRIDELDNGKQLIIDYKTGAEKSLAGWLNERLSEPQLPLYAAYAATQSHGLAYAQVHSSGAKFYGLIDHEDSQFLNLKPCEKVDEQARQWPQLIEDWRRKLSALSDDFMQGLAAVDPIPTACNYCNLQSICRIGMKEHESA